MPVVVSVGAGNPALRNTPVDSVDVVLSEPIDPASFDYQALSLTLNGGPNLITSGVTVTEINPTTYSIGGLGSLTAADGNYDLTVSAGGLVDGSGNSGVGFLSETWTMNTVGPTVASLPTYIQSPRNIVVPTIDVDLLRADRPEHVHLSEHHVFQAGRAEPDHAQHHDHAALADRVRDLQLQ